MEPDDIPVHDLLGVAGEPEPGPNELRAIVARAGRRRWATAGIAATLALALGLGIGLATSGQSSPPASQTARGSSGSGQNTPSNPTPSAASGAATVPGSSAGGTSSSSGLPPAVSPGRFTRLFTRTTGGTTVRGFLVTFPQIFAGPAGCQAGSTSHLQVEVSTAAMVGTVTGGLVAADRTQPISALSSEVVGSAEGDPTVVVTAAAEAGVAQVSMSFAGGTTDAMAPVDGWVALVAPAPRNLAYGADLGTITARAASGKPLGSQPLRVGVQSSSSAGSGCSIRCPERPQTGAGPTPAAACPPVSCRSVPGAPRPTAPPSTNAPAAVNPGGPVLPATGSAIAPCPLPAPASGGASGSSGASP